MLLKVLLVAVGGAVGSVARYGVSTAATKWFGTNFPWGTFAVNGIGCFLFGYLWALGEEKIAYSAEIRVLIFTGVLGGLTTFSSYTFESVVLARDGRLLAATANVLGQNVLSAVLFLAGLAVARTA